MKMKYSLSYYFETFTLSKEGGNISLEAENNYDLIQSVIDFLISARFFRNESFVNEVSLIGDRIEIKVNDPTGLEFCFFFKQSK